MVSSVPKVIIAGLLLNVIRECLGQLVPCPNGDHKGYVGSLLSECSDIVRPGFHGVCYEARIECCESCNRVYTNDTECAYGDKVIGCKKPLCPMLANKNDCCATCREERLATGVTTEATAGAIASPPSQTKATNVGAIVGGVIGGLAGTAVVGLGLFAGYRLYKKKKSSLEVP